MPITFNPAKRDATLRDRGLDFARAGEVFTGPHFTFSDERFDYGEDRFITGGHLDGRFVMLVWTLRGADRHIISMRHGHDREFRKYRDRLG